MSIKFFDGNLLTSGCDYICHQVNCMGEMNSGIAKEIKERWPNVFEVYKTFLSYKREIGYRPLGQIQCVDISDNQCVINMFAQDNYGYDNNRYTNYEAFYRCLEKIKITAPEGSKIGFPFGVGCVRGGANWSIIYAMIREVLDENYEVEIWRYDRG